MAKQIVLASVMGSGVPIVYNGEATLACMGTTLACMGRISFTMEPDLNHCTVFCLSVDTREV